MTFMHIYAAAETGSRCRCIALVSECTLCLAGYMTPGQCASCCHSLKMVVPPTVPVQAPLGQPSTAWPNVRTDCFTTTQQDPDK